uniref:Uncharacterized protein n=1 Tax=Cucumis melo TaxID=3656 RepID=A0A9I9EDV6_CUCME
MQTYIVVFISEREAELYYHRHLREVEIELHHHHPLRVAPSSFGELEAEMYYHHHARDCNTLKMNDPLDGRYWR